MNTRSSRISAQKIFYKEISQDHRQIFEGNITDSSTFLISLFSHCKQRPTEREIGRFRREIGDAPLSVGIRHVNPTVLEVAQTLNILEWDHALWYILPFVPKNADQDALRKCMAERRHRRRQVSASIAAGSGCNNDIGFDGRTLEFSPCQVEPSAPPWTESTAMTRNVVKKPPESVPIVKTGTAHDELRGILQALDRCNTPPNEQLLFPKRLFSPCAESSTEMSGREDVDGKPMYRKTFICSSTKDGPTRSALTEVQILLRFRNPCLPVFLAYKYAENLDGFDTIKLDIFTQWCELGSVASWICSTQPADWNIKSRIHVLLKIAKTLSFMHTNQAACAFHQNISTRTVVLHSLHHPVLVDFTNAIIVNKETDKADSMQDTEQRNILVRGHRRDVIGFAKFWLEVWSYRLWENSRDSVDLDKLTKEEKLTLIKQMLDKNSENPTSADHTGHIDSTDYSVVERVSQLISLLLCETCPEISLMKKVAVVLQNILADMDEK